MLLPTAIFSHLSAVAPLTALLRANSTAPVRVYPIRLPQNPVFPAVTYHVISDEREFSHGGRSKLQIARVQFSVWSKDESGSGGYASGAAVVQALHEALDGHDGAMGQNIAKCIPLGGRDLPESEPGIYHHAADFQIAFSES